MKQELIVAVCLIAASTWGRDARWEVAARHTLSDSVSAKGELLAASPDGNGFFVIGRTGPFGKGGKVSYWFRSFDKRGDEVARSTFGIPTVGKGLNSLSSTVKGFYRAASGEIRLFIKIPEIAFQVRLAKDGALKSIDRIPWSLKGRSETEIGAAFPSDSGRTLVIGTQDGDVVVKEIGISDSSASLLSSLTLKKEAPALELSSAVRAPGGDIITAVTLGDRTAFGVSGMIHILRYDAGNRSLKVMQAFAGRRAQVYLRGGDSLFISYDTGNGIKQALRIRVERLGAGKPNFDLPVLDQAHGLSPVALIPESGTRTHFIGIENGVLSAGEARPTGVTRHAVPTAGAGSLLYCVGAIKVADAFAVLVDSYRLAEGGSDVSYAPELILVKTAATAESPSSKTGDKKSR